MDLKFLKVKKRFNSLGKILRFYWDVLISSITFPMKRKVNVNQIYVSKNIRPAPHIVALGDIPAQFMDTVDKAVKLSDDFEEPDLLIYCSKGALTAAYGDEVNFFNVADHDHATICLNDIKIGIARFDDEGTEHINKFRRKVLHVRKCLKKAGADFFIAYADFKNGQGFLKKNIGTYGFDCVIGSGPSVAPKRSYRTMRFRNTRILYSLGNIRGKASAAYKFEIGKRKKNIEIIKEGYIPVCSSAINNNSIEILNRPVKWGDDAYREKRFLETEKRMRGSRRWDEIITLGDIFDVICEDLPSRYRYMKDYSVNQICTRSFEIEPGNIFFYRRQFNDRNDKKQQNEFLRLRLVLKAVTRKGLFIFSYRKLPFFIPHIVIDDPTEAHIKVMAWYRSQFLDTKFIGVTGSVGKTSTKDMIYSVLCQHFETRKNLRNTNVQVKIGINLQRIPANCQIYVQEIGGGRPGGASRHSRMILPDVTVVTNIGTAHIGNYDSKNDLMINKLGVIEGMNKRGMLYLNGDDNLLIDAHPECRYTYYAVDNKAAEFFADNIRMSGDHTFFDVVYKDKRVPAEICVLGKHNVLNAVCAVAVAKHFNMEDEEIVRGLKEFRTSGTRQNIVKTAGVTLFLDCYNASLESIGSSLNIFDEIQIKKSSKKVAVIGDITGAGDAIEEINKKVAETIDSYSLDHIVFYGKEARNIRKFLKKHADRSVCIEKEKELEKWLETNVNRGDALLLKGSSKMKLDERVDSVFGINTSDQRYIDESNYLKYNSHNVIYNIFNEYASVKRCMSKKKNIRINKKVGGKPIKKIYMKAFLNNQNVNIVHVGQNVRHIGSLAFRNCKNLEKVYFSENVRFVGNKAFENCTNLKYVEFSGNLLFLGRDVFENCSKLQQVVVPVGFNEVIKKRLLKGNIKVIEK